MAGRKGSSSKIQTYYSIDGNKASKMRKICSRCGRGTFMSNHKDRHHCGKCNLTEFIQ